jgi:hypothetical protein
MAVNCLLTLECPKRLIFQKQSSMRNIAASQFSRSPHYPQYSVFAPPSKRVAVQAHIISSLDDVGGTQYEPAE